MKFSSQEEYGLRCLLQLARRGVQASITIPEISQAEGLSTANAAKLMRVLRLEGFVESARGQEGGYSLSRPAETIYVSDVLAALGGKMYEPGFCDHYSGNEDACAHSFSCSIKPLWSRVQAAIDQSLKGITIVDLLPTALPVNITLPGKKAQVSV